MNLPHLAQETAEKWHPTAESDSTLICGLSELILRALEVVRDGLLKENSYLEDSRDDWKTEALNLRNEYSASQQEGKQKLAEVMMNLGLATGHGESLEDLLKELEWQFKELRNELTTLHATIDRIWTALGISTYEQAKPSSIDEHVSTLRAREERLREALERLSNMNDDAAMRESARQALAGSQEGEK